MTRPSKSAQVKGEGLALGRPGERSFTLIETVIALGLMVTVIFEVSGVQGHAIYFSEFERNVTRATWLAKGIMAKLEYEWDTRPFTEMKELNVAEREFEDNKEFTYAVKVEEWKLPLLDLLTGGGGGGGGDEDKADPQADMIKGYVEKIFGDEILKTANVEVFWPDGAKRDSVSLTMLLTNQAKLDELIATLPPATEPKKDEKKPPDTNKAPKKPTERSVEDPQDSQDPIDADGGAGGGGTGGE